MYDFKNNQFHYSAHLEYMSVQMHLYKKHLNWEFLYHPREQWVLFDVKFATCGEPDHVSIPMLPIA